MRSADLYIYIYIHMYYTTVNKVATLLRNYDFQESYLAASIQMFLFNPKDGFSEKLVVCFKNEFSCSKI